MAEYQNITPVPFLSLAGADNALCNYYVIFIRAIGDVGDGT
jgi:hypothetical protein